MPEREEGHEVFMSLADRYDELVKMLDAVVGEAIILIEKANQRSLESLVSRQIQKNVGLLDEFAFQLHVWASDLTFQNFVSKSGNLAMRELNTRDVLNILDASQMPIVRSLHRTFGQVETNVSTFSRTTDLMINSEDVEWVGHCATLDKATGSIEQALLELDRQKLRIRERINCTTADDMERGLLNDTIVSAKGSVLSIDGGGVRSYSSILIIRALMEEVRSVVRDMEMTKIRSQRIVPADDIRPADIFEYVFGSSSGGLIAIMLGRLKMSEDQCLESFQKYADEVFSHPRWKHRLSGGLLSTKYSSEHLNRAIKMVVGNFDPSPGSLQLKRNLWAVPGERCKTGVTAYALQAVSPHIFRTYSQDSSSGKSRPFPAVNYQTWEVARATSAAPHYFPYMNIGQTSFVDGGFGTNNPAREALKEILASREAMSPYIRLPKVLIVSVGSGVKKQDSASDSSSSKRRLISAATSLISNTEAVHKDMLVMAKTQDADYFRFAVDHGLSDISLDTWNVNTIDGTKRFTTLETINVATEIYLKQQNVVDQLRQCARLLVDRLTSNPFSSQSASSLSTIPVRRKSHFVGREDILHQIHEAFHNQNHVALVGLGGIGKSSVATEYAFRHRSHYKLVFWMNADTFSTFQQSLRSTAEVFKIPGRGDANTDVFELVCNWLHYHARDGWLMILDSFGEETIFAQKSRGDTSHSDSMSGKPSMSMSTLLPQNPKGRILITSRSKAIAFSLVGSYKTIIEVGAMSVAESIDLFSTRYAGEYDRDVAQELTQALEFLPLAIVLAANYLYLRAPRLTVRRYLAEFQETQKSLLSIDPADLEEHGNSLSKTWGITFEKIRGYKPSAWRLLSLMSLCGSNDIPDYLVRDYRENGMDRSKNTIDLDFEDDISTLTSYSVIKINIPNNLFSIHRLVQSAIQRWLEACDELIEWKQKYLVILEGLFPEHPHEGWQTCTALSSHLDTALTYRPADHRYLRHWAFFLVRVARYAEARGQYDRAEELNIRAMEGIVELFGSGHPEIIKISLNLALIYSRQGKFNEAKELNIRAEKVFEKVFGSENPKTLETSANLALIYSRQGKFNEAKELNIQVEKVFEKVFGSENPKTLESIANLALIYVHQSKFGEAEELNIRVMEGFERILGSEHSKTLESISNLAFFYLRQGKLGEAELMSGRALVGKEKVLGVEHPSTLHTMTVLGSVLRGQGRLEEAKATTQRALKGMEEKLGLEHPSTLNVMSDMALVLRDQGELEMAERMIRRALEGQQKVLGVDHPDRLDTGNRLALILNQRRKYQATEEVTKEH